MHQTEFVTVRRERADRKRQSMAIHNRHDFHAISAPRFVVPIAEPPRLAMAIVATMKPPYLLTKPLLLSPAPPYRPPPPLPPPPYSSSFMAPL